MYMKRLLPDSLIEISSLLHETFGLAEQLNEHKHRLKLYGLPLAAGDPEVKPKSCHTYTISKFSQ